MTGKRIMNLACVRRRATLAKRNNHRQGGFFFFFFFFFFFLLSVNPAQFHCPQFLGPVATSSCPAHTAVEKGRLHCCSMQLVFEFLEHLIQSQRIPVNSLHLSHAVFIRP